MKIIASLLGLTATVLAWTGSASAAVLEQVSPVSTAYIDLVDFRVMQYSATGDVTTALLGVDLGSTTSSCEAADYAGFVAGSIALLKRGTCQFELKAENAAAAGAVGVLKFNNLDDLFGGSVQPTYTGGIPVMSLSGLLGQELMTSTAGITMRMYVTVEDLFVPEPGTLALLGLGLAGLVASRRRKG